MEEWNKQSTQKFISNEKKLKQSNILPDKGSAADRQMMNTERTNQIEQSAENSNVLD